MDAAIAEKVRDKLEDFISDPARFFEVLTDIDYLRRIGVELNALPLLIDMGGCCALRPNGEIISVSWDDITDVQIETDKRLRNIVLFEGSKKYKGMEVLAPKRSVDALECPHCKGTGILELSRELGITEPNIKCYCGGLGWLPADSETK